MHALSSDFRIKMSTEKQDIPAITALVDATAGIIRFTTPERPERDTY